MNSLNRSWTSTLLFALFCLALSSNTSSYALPQALSEMQFQTVLLPSATAYVVRIPKSPTYMLFPSISSNLDSVEKQVFLLRDSNFISPVAGLNAGFFDPKSAKPISFVVKNGVTISNPEQNNDLMANKVIQPYLKQVLNRSEFRVLDCMSGLRYDIQQHNDVPPPGCRIRNSIQAGPLLNNSNALINEAFAAYDKAGKVTRDPIGFRYKNARSAIGIDTLGQPILVMVSQRVRVAEAPQKIQKKLAEVSIRKEISPLPTVVLRAPVPSLLAEETTQATDTIAAAINLDQDQIASGTGVSISELGDFMTSLGAVKSMALDGGSSSSMWVTSKNFFGKVNKLRQPIQRRIKSAWVVGHKRS